MKSIFRYPGGKSKAMICNWILSNMPANAKSYREPFVGGGGIFFALDPSRVSDRWINDKHEGLVSVYQALRDRPADFIATCRSMAPAKDGEPMTDAGPRGGLPQNQRLYDEFQRVRLNTEVDQAYRYFFVNRTVHGSGRVNYDIPSRLYFSNATGWNIVATDRLEQAAKHLAGCKITAGDYRELLAAPGEDVWIYCDPPYVVNGDLSRTSQLYQHSFTETDQVAFRDVLETCDHSVAVSYDDCDFVRDLFRGWHFAKAAWKYCGTGVNEKRSGRELLIMNYQPSRTLVRAPGMDAPFPLLDGDEQKDLAELEGELRIEHERHKRCALRVGQILLAICERKLYQEKYRTFEEYCETEWGMDRRRAYHLRDYAKLVGKMCTQIHISELAARPLVTLMNRGGDPDQALAEAAELDGGKPTAKTIKSVVDSWLGKGEPKPKRPKLISVDELKSAISDLLDRLEIGRVAGQDILRSWLDEQKRECGASVSELCNA